MNFLNICLSLAIAVTTISPLHAAVVYKWVDDEGKTHFTDNLANVPLQQENYEKRTLKGIKPTNNAAKPITKLALGKKIWQSTCSQCHFIKINYENKPLRQLPNKFLKPNTSLEDMTKKLDSSLKLRSADMNDIVLSPEETQAVAQYILHRITQ